MAPPPLPQAVAFHVALNGAQQGPFDVNALRTLAGQGQVQPTTLVWRQGMAGWTAAKDVPDLGGLFAMAGPPRSRRPRWGRRRGSVLNDEAEV